MLQEKLFNYNEKAKVSSKRKVCVLRFNLVNQAQSQQSPTSF